MSPIIAVILFSFVFILFFLLGYVLYRLNVYLSILEDKLSAQIRLTENLKQSMKEIIAEDFLQNDGRLKKFQIQNERHVIFNGVRVDESMVGEL